MALLAQIYHLLDKWRGRLRSHSCKNSDHPYPSLLWKAADFARPFLYLSYSLYTTLPVRFLLHHPPSKNIAAMPQALFTLLIMAKNNGGFHSFARMKAAALPGSRLSLPEADNLPPNRSEPHPDHHIHHGNHKAHFPPGSLVHIPGAEKDRRGRSSIVCQRHA